ncbi:methyltransferase domain protein [Lyngbya aestuarii BL J]|uniref:Methyltransferase domain protein n=1 Tax=Lyngbya aestuarii BL J TaxID=1348334 RepID=U7QBU0_9CYAN|nr:class I SAM-dependent methyltransferase [Lyngbya aestuarii]ERT05329.1 methyltransferase domain protein [Lyngbya aestuarii BL J]
MLSSSKSTILQSYEQDAFALKQHLQDYLNLDQSTLETQLESSLELLAELGHRDFDWENASLFYREKVGEIYLFELGAWHLTSQDYIGNTLRMISDHARGKVLDFGGGIGTHAIASALSPQVERVIYCDINPINQAFVRFRVEQLGLSDKVKIQSEISLENQFDTILCFDVIEHLPAPSQQLLTFHKLMSDQGKIILNWYFYKGENQEYPFHLDDPQKIELFFQTIQRHFLEVFHPYLITTRCYQKLILPN